MPILRLPIILTFRRTSFFRTVLLTVCKPLIPLPPATQGCLVRIELPQYRATSFRRSADWGCYLHEGALQHLVWPSLGLTAARSLELANDPVAIGPFHQNARIEGICVEGDVGVIDLLQDPSLAGICIRATPLGHLGGGVSHFPVSNRLDPCCVGMKRP
jgi:hypothetical protein